MFIKFLKKFFIYCTLISFTSSSVNAYIPELFDGADKGIQELAKQKGMPAPNYLLPSSRFMMMQSLKHMRFDGHLGPWNKGLGLPFNMQGIDASDVGAFPQDARSALLQCLFPCPDGVILLANQASSDILSQITPTTMGAILRQVQAYAQTSKDSRNENLLKTTLYSLLVDPQTPVSQQQFQALVAEHAAFLQHDYKVGVFRFLANMSEEMLAVVIENLGMSELEDKRIGEVWRAIDNCLSRNGRKPMGASFKKHLGDMPSYEEMNTLEEYNQEMETLKKLKQKKNLSAEEKNLQSTLQDKHKISISFEDRRKQFRALGFVESLMRAYDEQENLSDSSFPYADYMVEQTLMSYFWLTALNLDDVADFYGALFETPPTQVKPLFSKTISRDGYIELKEKIQGGHITDLTPEILSAAARGFDMYENPLPPLIQFKSAQYTPKNVKKSRLTGSSFPDCVETSVRNAIDIHAYAKNGEFYESNISLLKLTEATNTALECDSFLRFSQDAHNRWGSYLAEIPGVNYLKPAQSREKKYELQPVWFNTLRVWAHLLGDRGQALLNVLDPPHDNESAEAQLTTATPSSNDDDDDDANELPTDDEEQESPEKLKKAFGVLSNLLSRENHTVEFSIEGDDPDWNKKFSDFTAKANVIINGVKTYIWEQDSSHSSVKYEPITLNDWRKNTMLTLPFKELGNLAVPFLKSWAFSFELISDHMVRNFFWALDFSNRDVLIPLFEISTKKDTPIWNQIQIIIIKHLKELDDDSTEGLLTQKIADALTRIEAPLSPQRLDAILRVFPKLLSNHAEMTKWSEHLGQHETYPGQFLYVLNSTGHTIFPLAKERMKRLSINEGCTEVINALGEFKKLKILTIDGWKNPWLLELLPKLPGTLKAINFIMEPTSAAEGIEIVKTLLERFPRLNVAIPVEGKENLKELEAYIKNLEKNGEDQFLLTGQTFG